MKLRWLYTIICILFASNIVQAKDNAESQSVPPAKMDTITLLSKLDQLFHQNHKQLDSAFQLILFSSLKLEEQIQVARLQTEYFQGLRQRDTTAYNIFNNHLNYDQAFIYYCEWLSYQNKAIDNKDKKRLLALVKDSTGNHQHYTTFVLGLLEKQENNYDEAIRYFEIVIQSNSVPHDLLVRSYIQLGKCYDGNAKYQLAYESFQNALALAEENNFTYYRATVQVLLGNVQLNLGNRELAMKFYEQSRNTSEAVHATRLMGLSLANIGYINMLENDPKTAIYFYQNALVLLYKIKDQLTIGRVQKRLGKAYFMFENYTLARESYLLSLYYFESLQDTVFLARIHYSFAELEYETGNIKQAEVSVKKSIDFHKKSRSYIGLSDAYLLLSQIYAISDNHPKAYNYLLRSTKIRDSLETSETKNKIAELNLLYQSEKQERIISQQQVELEEQIKEALLKDKEIENRTLRIQQMVFIAIMLVLILISLIMMYKYKSKKQKISRLEKEADLKQVILRTQMNPHFLFNGLSVIQGYIFDNNKAASSQFLANFSKLMRLILENSSKDFIPLKVELEIIKRYLEVQQMRFEERFEYEIISDSTISKNSIEIPPMMMQPFLENAIEHGQLQNEANGKITIRYVLQKNLIIFTIEDNGIGILKAIPKKHKNHKSMAITITKERIALINKKMNTQGRLTIEDLSSLGSKGTRVTLTIPFEYINEQ